MIQTRSIVWVLTCATILCGCSKTLDFRNAEISQGKVYLPGANEPFSGKLTNIPFEKLPASKVYSFAVQSAQAKSKNALIYTSVFGETHGALCNTKVNNGIVDGEATCSMTDGGMPVFKFNFENGQLNGDVTVYDLQDKGSVLASGHFANGQLAGT